jgi:putative transposase
MEDECHLLWGDTTGHVWGKRNEQIAVSMDNQRLRQTYYGAVDILTGDFYNVPKASGNGIYTVEYIKYLQKILMDKKLMIIWDGASYHRFSEMREYLQEVNKNLPPEEWLITCELFAPNAPKQNPVEDIWLQGKNHLRKEFAENTTFAKVKKSFEDYYKSTKFNFSKIEMYRSFLYD